MTKRVDDSTGLLVVSMFLTVVGLYPGVSTVTGHSAGTQSAEVPKMLHWHELHWYEKVVSGVHENP